MLSLRSRLSYFLLFPLLCPTGRQSKPLPPELHSLLLDAHSASTPDDCYRTAWQLGKRVQYDQQMKQRYSDMQMHDLETAADTLAAALLGGNPGSAGSSGSNKSAQPATPFQQLNSKKLSLSVWGFAKLAECNSSIVSRQLH